MQRQNRQRFSYCDVAYQMIAKSPDTILRQSILK